MVSVNKYTGKMVHPGDTFISNRAARGGYLRHGLGVGVHRSGGKGEGRGGLQCMPTPHGWCGSETLVIDCRVVLK